MADDKFDKLGPLLNAIGAEGTAIVGGNPDGLYIYAEAEDGAVHAGVFRDEGNTIRYFAPTEELFQLIGDAWEAESPNKAKRWAAMEYEVHGTAFDVRFTYPEELDPTEYVTDRRRAALERRYGDKPVIYPPMPEDMPRRD